MTFFNILYLKSYLGALCYLRCLLEGKPFLKVMSTAIRDTLNDLCAPIHTIFYEVFKSAQIGAGHLKTYAKFNEALGVNPNFGHDTSKVSEIIICKNLNPNLC